ncbi:hypothetical protein KIW84_022357, partial [Lathyrus oleraceus]
SIIHKKSFFTMLLLHPLTVFLLFCYTISTIVDNLPTKLSLNAESRNVFPDHEDSTEITIFDMLRNSSQFNHVGVKNNSYILRGGWPKFWKKKNLAVGDTLIFMRDTNSRYIISIKRAFKPSATVGPYQSIVRRYQGSVNTVEDALGHIMGGNVFQVLFHPSVCSYLVDSHRIGLSRAIGYVNHMRVNYLGRAA